MTKNKSSKPRISLLDQGRVHTWLVENRQRIAEQKLTAVETLELIRQELGVSSLQYQHLRRLAERTGYEIKFRKRNNHLGKSTTKKQITNTLLVHTLADLVYRAMFQERGDETSEKRLQNALLQFSTCRRVPARTVKAVYAALGEKPPWDLDEDDQPQVTDTVRHNGEARCQAQQK